MLVNRFISEINGDLDHESIDPDGYYTSIREI